MQPIQCVSRCPRYLIGGRPGKSRSSFQTQAISILASACRKCPTSPSIASTIASVPNAPCIFHLPAAFLTPITSLIPPLEPRPYERCRADGERSLCRLRSAAPAPNHRRILCADGAPRRPATAPPSPARARCARARDRRRPRPRCRPRGWPQRTRRAARRCPLRREHACTQARTARRRAGRLCA